MSTIREIQPQDFPQVASLIVEQVYDNEASPAEIERWMKATRKPFLICYVVCDEQEVQGVVAWRIDELLKDSLVLDLAWIALRPELQRNGFGRKFLGETLRKVLQFPLFREKEVLYLSVETDESNKGAIAFYEKVWQPFSIHVIPGKGVWYAYAELETVLANTQGT
jgi:ribosomal protein S18 acetylase RimI-like enzyme